MLSLSEPSSNALAHEVVALRRDVESLKRGLRATQLQNASIENGSLNFYDNGMLVQSIGQQPDGSYAVVNQNPPVPPPRPNTPDVAPFAMGLGISWNGEFSTGDRPSDFANIEIYLGSTPTFIAGTSNFYGTLAEAGGLPVTPLDSGSTYYAMFIATNTSEKPADIGTGIRVSASEPSLVASGTPTAVVATEILDGIVTEASLADSAVTRAKIATDAIDGTKIEDGSITSPLIAANTILAGNIAASQIQTTHLVAGSVTTPILAALAVKAGNIDVNTINAGHIQASAVTAAKLEAELLLASRVVVGTLTGNRVELHPTLGLQGFASSGTVRTLWLDASTGDLTVVGTIRTAPTGQRLELLTDGTMRLYPSSGSNYSELANFGSAGMIFRGPLTGSDTAFMELNSTEARLRYGTTSGSSQSQLAIGGTFINTRAPFTGFRVDRTRAVGDGSDQRIIFMFTTTGGADDGATNIHFERNTAEGSSRFRSTAYDVGLQFGASAANALFVCNNAGASMPIWAAAFTTFSSRVLKENISEITYDGGRTSWDIVEGAPSLDWNYIHENPSNRPPKPTDGNGNPVLIRKPNPDIDPKTWAKLDDSDPLKWVYEEQEWAVPATPRNKHRLPLAEDIEAIAPNVLSYHDEFGGAIDLRDMVGILWDAVDMLIKRNRYLEDNLNARGFNLGDRPQVGDMKYGVGASVPGLTKRNLDATDQVPGRAHPPHPGPPS